MKEDFLHYLWQFQQFDHQDLHTVSGERISIIRVGEHNTNAGPDFLNAQLKIGEVVWAGSVEIHLKSSDWIRHKHQTDQKYDNTILHVVWEQDLEIYRTDRSLVPTLELKNRVTEEKLINYQQLIKPKPSIPCSPFFNQVPELTRFSMLDRCLHERLQQKAQEVAEILEAAVGDWEVTCYQWLFKAFGFKINSEPFFRLSKTLPYKFIRRHYGELFQIEALLFGQAGFLKEPQDEYSVKLEKEYQYLSGKYGLGEQQMHFSDWNFLRLRPANFPTVRLSQLAAVLANVYHFRDSLLHLSSIAEGRAFFQHEPSDYWQTHYRLGIETDPKKPVIGISSVANLLSNAVAPLLVCYAKQKSESVYLDNTLSLLESIKAEKNHITFIYETLGQKVTSAADSQALLQLYRYYCEPVKCLQCAIGVKIVKGLNG